MDAIKMISNPEYTTTIEAEPVRHGEWVKNDLGQTFCSICKRRLPTVMQYYCDSDDLAEDTEIDETEFCPNCGTKMDEGRKEK